MQLKNGACCFLIFNSCLAGIQVEYELSFGMMRGKMQCLIFAGCKAILASVRFSVT